ncbi:MAG: lysylphosphatidylglycerol synthase transmembrane domain-containing protein [Litorimonas sp.]
MSSIPVANNQQKPTTPPKGVVKILQAWLKSPWLIAAMVISLIIALHFIAPLSEWQAAFSQAEPVWLLSAILLVLPHEILKVLRMEQLIPCVKPHRILHAKIVYGMSFVTQLPVGTVGGDVYRVMRLEDCGASPKDATAATFLMRLIGFSTTLIIAGLGGMIILQSVIPIIGPILGAAIIVLLTTSKNPPSFLARLVKRSDETGRGKLGRLLSRLARLLSHTFQQAADLTRQQIMAVLGVTLGLYAVRAVIVWFCLLALDLDVSYGAALAALAVGNLASTIPSPAGNIGLREGGMVGVLAGLGVAVAPATISALLFRAAMILGAGLGLVLAAFAYKLVGPKQVD